MNEWLNEWMNEWMTEVFVKQPLASPGLLNTLGENLKACDGQIMKGCCREYFKGFIAAQVKYWKWALDLILFFSLTIFWFFNIPRLLSQCENVTAETQKGGWWWECRGIMCLLMSQMWRDIIHLVALWGNTRPHELSLFQTLDQLGGYEDSET